MKLADYLRSRGITPYRFGRVAGVAHTTVSRLVAGAHVPRAETRQRISVATGGMVSERDLLLEGASLEGGEYPDVSGVEP